MRSRLRMAFWAGVAGLLVVGPAPRMVNAAPVAADPAAASAARDIPLQHAAPADVISLLRWNDPKKMPDGVRSVTADAATNSLRVVATAEGFAQVQELVSFVDIPVRQVRVDVRYVLARQADIASYGIAFGKKGASAPAQKKASADDFLLNASGALAARMLDDFTKKGDVVSSPEIKTANNKPATLRLHGPSIVNGFPEIEDLSFGVSPRVNSDGTVTMPLDLSVTIGGSGAAGEVPDGQSAEQVFNVVRTVKDGETFVAANLAHTDSDGGSKVLLVFVIPHIGALQ